MPKKKLQQFDKVKGILVGVVIGLSVILITILLNLADLNRNHENTVSNESRVSLGPMTYDFTGEKAVKREDETVKSLRAFLVSLTERDDQHDCDSYYNVVLASTDEKQVLLNYGCPYPSASMFAINEGGQWRTISPTNQFDMFGIPACEHLNENSIDKSIAPVCVNGMENTATSQILTYSIR